MKKNIYIIAALFTFFSNLTGNAYASDNLSCSIKTLDTVTISLLKNKDYAGVISLYDTCIKKYPNNADFYNNRGNAYLALKKYDLALNDYRKAISLNPKYVTPYNGLATVYIYEGQVDKALDALNNLMQNDPDNVSGALNRAQVNMITKDYESAIKDYNVVLKDKKKSVYYKDRAYAYLASSKPQQAINDYESYLKAGHSSAEAYRYLGVAYGITGNNEKSLECLRKAAELYKKENNIEEYNNIMKIFRSN